MADAMIPADVATRIEIAALRQEINQSRTDLPAGIPSLRTEPKEGFGGRVNRTEAGLFVPPHWSHSFLRAGLKGEVSSPLTALKGGM